MPAALSEAIHAAGTNVAPVSLAEEHRSGVLNDGKEPNVPPPRPSSKGFVPSGVACGPRSSAASEGRLSAAEAPTSMRRTWALAYRQGLIVRRGRSVVAVPHAWSSCAGIHPCLASQHRTDRLRANRRPLVASGRLVRTPPWIEGAPAGVLQRITKTQCGSSSACFSR